MIKIINKDIMEGIKDVADNSVDLIFADPPYNLAKVYEDNIKDDWGSEEEYLNWIYMWLDEAIKKLKTNGTLYIMNTTQNMPYIDIFLRNKIYVKSRIVWAYDSSGVQAKKFYGSLYEPLLHCTKSRSKYTFNYGDILVPTKTGAERGLIDYRKNPPEKYSDTKVPGNVWFFNRVRFKMNEYVKHPTQKPEALLERIVLASSNKNDLVLDLFAGSFSLGMVCKRLERNYIGIELSKTYCDNGKSRIGVFTNQEPEIKH